MLPLLRLSCDRVEAEPLVVCAVCPPAPLTPPPHPHLAAADCFRLWAGLGRGFCPADNRSFFQKKKKLGTLELLTLIWDAAGSQVGLNPGRLFVTTRFSESFSLMHDGRRDVDRSCPISIVRLFRSSSRIRFSPLPDKRGEFERLSSGEVRFLESSSGFKHHKPLARLS